MSAQRYITAITIDDEELCNKALEVELKRYCPDIRILGTYTDPQSGMEAILHLKPDIVFLDIEMPGCNGFELMDQLRPVEFEVIFITAYNEFALKAFRANALDYLLKPIEPPDLVSAVHRAITKIKQNNRNEELETLLNRYTSSYLPDIISLPTQEGLEFIQKKDIMYCEAEGNYTYVYTIDQKRRLIPKTLKDIENLIHDLGFLRIHQSYLANMAYVLSYNRQDGGSLEMKNGKRLPVSRARKEELINKFRG